MNIVIYIAESSDCCPDAVLQYWEIDGRILQDKIYTSDCVDRLWWRNYCQNIAHMCNNVQCWKEMVNDVRYQ